MADPRFPIGGADPLGAPTSNTNTFWQKTFVKMKELDPVGGCVPAAPPVSANAIACTFESRLNQMPSRCSDIFST